MGNDIKAKPSLHQELIRELAQLLTETGLTEIEIDRFFFDWAGGRRRGASPHSMLYAAPAFADFAQAIGKFEPVRSLDHPYWADADPCSMHIEEVEAIWADISERDDWRAFEEKVGAIRRMGEAMAAGSSATLSTPRSDASG